MNVYRHQFVSECPADHQDIVYRLEIQSKNMIRVEQIITAAAIEKKAFHEEIADRLFTRFGGLQVITAMHQGVEVETRRGGA